MTPPYRGAALKLTLTLLLGLSGCGGGGSSGGGSPPPPTYSLGGSITGLVAAGLVLQNGANSVTLQSSAANFAFSTTYQTGTSYSISVKTQPTGELCQIANGSGTVGSAAVTNVSITCTRYWTWMSGSDVGYSVGTYGTMGTTTAGNLPGARTASFTWTDSSGNLWLFGGNGYGTMQNPPGYLADLWRYSPATGDWTWMSGSNSLNPDGVYGTQHIASSSNQPGGRTEGASWTDASGNFWLFGGAGYASTGTQGTLNDLWKYSFTTGEWTWVSGSNVINQSGVYGTRGIAAAANTPGARIAPVAWTDASGNLWLFGGSGYDSNGTDGLLNDLWRFNVSTGEWTWVSGSSIAGASGSYGTRGVAASSNAPGARNAAAAWTDASGNLWLLGGTVVSNGSTSGFNDLWEYSTSAGEWTWMGGSNTPGAPGVYGTQGVPATTNTPGARDSASAWTDSKGVMWLYGGLTTIAPGAGYLNDLWRYDPSSGEWTWVSGPSTSNVTAVWGTQGVTAATNLPGARLQGASWADPAGRLWLFGGFGLFSGQSTGALNDLWRY